MAILVKPVLRVNPRDPEGPRQWHITQVSTAQVDESQVAMDIADETTLNPAEAMMALRQLRKIVLRHLLAGETVKLGNWGSFSVTISSSPVATRAAVEASGIRSVNLRFKPDAQFKADL